jgi:hypothetical protein
MYDVAEHLKDIPVELWLRLIADAAAREVVTARRAALLGVIWQESHVSRAGLIARVEALVGAGCFGTDAAAAFGRDIRALKGMVAAAGLELRFSRRAGRSGYTIEGWRELVTSIVAAAAEPDDASRAAGGAASLPPTRGLTNTRWTCWRSHGW